MSVYTVQAGDTLESIAKLFLVSVTDLQKWNNGKFPSLYSTTLPLNPGWVINVSPPSRTTYNVTDFGAIGHDITRNDGSVIAGSTSFVSKDGTFKSGDVGTNITVDYAATNTTLSDMLIQGASYSLLTVNPLTTEIASGANVVVQFGSYTQTFVAAAAAPVGAIYITVNAQTANYSYPIGSYVDPANLTTTITSVSSPTLITLGADATITAFGLSYTYTPDDTAAIQAAINTAATGGDVFIPYTNDGYRVGAISLLEGVRIIFSEGARFIAPSSLTTSWLKTTGTNSDGVAIVNGTFDATAVTSTTVVAVLDFSGASSCPNVRIIDNKIINAPSHGIYLSEVTKTERKKWVERNSVEGHGITTAGYGIYCDYIGSVEVNANYVFSSNSYDAIELGHSGNANLGINAHLRATNNTVVNGQIQFPFSDHAEIIGNTVVNNTIQNDTNTANYVTIANNVILNSTPASGYAGIRVVGDYPTIVGNQVQVTTGSGIQLEGSLNGIVTGNQVVSTATTATGVGIYLQGGTSGTNNNTVVSSNNVRGGFQSGVVTDQPGNSIIGNEINLDSGEYGIAMTSSAVTGFLANNQTIYNNVISGATTAILLGDNNLDGCFIKNNQGYNPTGPQTAPSMPASGTSLTNPFFFDAAVYISGGTVTAIAVGGTATGLTSGSVIVPAGETITLTYSAAPTWVWIGN